MEALHGILIVESVGLIRASLLALLADVGGLEILAAMEDFFHAMLAITSLKPQIVLVGLSTSAARSIEFVRNVKRMRPDVRVLVLTFAQQEEYVQACLQAGADGIVSRDANQEELAAAVRNALSGTSYCNASRTVDVFNKKWCEKQGMYCDNASDCLTARERDVLRFVARAYSNKQIARHLGVSVSTVEKHRANMLKKLDLHNVAEATAYAFEKGLVSMSAAT